MPHLVLEVGDFCLKSLDGSVQLTDLHLNRFQVMTFFPGNDLELLVLEPGKGESKKVAWGEPTPGLLTPQTSMPPAQSGLCGQNQLIEETHLSAENV